MVCETSHTAEGDEPFGRIVLVPQEGVAVVHWELMVEVVVSLTHRDDCRDKVVAGCMYIVEGG